MPITQKHIDELKVIYLEQYKKELSDEEAWAMAHRLVNLYKVLITAEAKRERKKSEVGKQQRFELR